MAGYIVCINASGTTPGGNPVGIIALNGKNGDVPLEGVGPSPYLYDHHSIAQEAVGFNVFGRPATSAEWESFKANLYDINDYRNRNLLGGAYYAANSAIDFQAFKNGVYQITGFTVTRTGNSGEGADIYVDLTTLAIPTGITIYWTITTITGAALNGITPSSGSTVVTSTAPGNWPGTAQRITVTPDLDNITEGLGSFVMQIRQGGTGGLVFYTSGPIAVADTSLYPYFGTTPGGIDEGASGTFNVVGYDITGPRSPATYYWSIDNNTARFATINGSVVISNNAGSFTISPLANLQTDGATTVTVSLRKTSVSGTIIASKTFTINDTSLTPTFTSQPTSINEGSAGTFNVSGYTAGTNQTFYYSLRFYSGGSGNAVTSDFAAVNGSFTINNGGSFTVTPLADSISEGDPTLSPYFSSSPRIVGGTEVFAVELRRGSVSGTVVAVSNIITINDTSLNPLVALNYGFTGNLDRITLIICGMGTAGASSFSGGPYQLCRANTINVTVNSCAVIYGRCGSAALTFTGGRTDDVVNLIVNGIIHGYGGNGKCHYNCGSSGGSFFNGGVALKLGLQSVVLSGSGMIAGGGGGGGSYTSSNGNCQFALPVQAPAPGGGGAGGGNGGGGSGSGSFTGQGNPVTASCASYTTNMGGSQGIYFTARAGGGGSLKTGGYVGYGLNQQTAAGQTQQGNVFYPQRGLGGGQGGGGGAGSNWSLSLSSNLKGGNGGVGNGVGGTGQVPAAGGYLFYHGAGGGGGWAAAGGSGVTQGRAGTAASAGGAGGKAICLNGRGVSGSVTTQYGAVS